MADQFAQEASRVRGVEEIAACARRLTPIYCGWEVFLFETNTRRHLGRICIRKRCPARSVDCAVPGCGAIPLVQVIPGFTFDPIQAFAHRPAVLWRRGDESIVERWYAEVHEQSKPRR